jgi:hypothetical protein
MLCWGPGEETEWLELLLGGDKLSGTFTLRKQHLCMVMGPLASRQLVIGIAVMHSSYALLLPCMQVRERSPLEESCCSACCRYPGQPWLI